jgi:large subunit ribosomal protein L4
VEKIGEAVKLDVYEINGSKSDKQESLRSKVFGIEPHDHSLWLAVTAELRNRQQGTVSTKNRSAVSGGGRKPWRQKGRGTARAGTIRSPLWRGGGRIFGPSPRDLSQRLPRKVGRLARKSALSYKAKNEKICLIEDFSFDEPKTKQMVSILKNLKLEQIKTLLLTPESNQNLWLSGRNIHLLAVKEATGFSTYDVMNADMLLIQRSALKKIYEVLEK